MKIHLWRLDPQHAIDDIRRIVMEMYSSISKHIFESYAWLHSSGKGLRIKRWGPWLAWRGGKGAWRYFFLPCMGWSLSHHPNPNLTSAPPLDCGCRIVSWQGLAATWRLIFMQAWAWSTQVYTPMVCPHYPGKGWVVGSLRFFGQLCKQMASLKHPLNPEHQGFSEHSAACCRSCCSEHATNSPENQWKSMKIHEINENQWKTMKIHEINENPWKFQKKDKIWQKTL